MKRNNELNDQTWTPERAMATLANDWAVQRSVTRFNVTNLTDAMDCDEFVEGLSLIVLADWPGSGGAVVLDGRHRLTALAEIDRTFILATRTYHLQSEHEAKALYAKMDRNRRRSIPNIAKALVDPGQNPTHYAKLHSALNVLVPGRHSDTEMQELCRQWQGVYRNLQAALPCSLTSGSHHDGSPEYQAVRLLSYRRCLAVALASVAHGGVPAAQWWAGVCMVPPPTRTQAMAREQLMSSRGANDAATKQIAQRLARAYLAHGAGDSIKLLKASRQQIGPHVFWPTAS